MKIYRCKHCGQIIVKIKDTDVSIICCGDEMNELIPGTSDGAIEKHVPVVAYIEDKKIKVNVGSENHPMVDKHYIEWILVETTKGFQIKYLKPNEEPHKCFKLCDCEEVISVYAYCNLHGLWKA